MLNYVRAERPRVPNPTHPDEDYADKHDAPCTGPIESGIDPKE
jgi:hypothetical protein